MRFLKSEIGVNLLTFAGVLILLLIMLAPMAFEGMRPGGADVIGSLGKTHQKAEYQEKTGETVLWNSPIFSGMPIYHRLGGKAYSLDTFLVKVMDNVFYLNIWIYLIGFIGMFYLLKSLTNNYWAALFSGLAFMLIPHYMSLLSIGHFAKFRPIMYMPLVTFLFINVINKRNLVWLAGFIIMFSVQIRTQHYQIIFYQLMVLVFLGVYLLIKLGKEKGWNRVGFKLALFAGAALLVIIMVAQPLFIIKEYTPYSIRGGSGEAGSTGVTSDYATGWSFEPAGILVWMMPRFLGGRSGELYEGDISQLDGRNIPGYWGKMPFTEAYEYAGIMLLLLAVFGVVLYWKNGLIRTLFALFILGTLLAFGRHLPFLYNLFFDFVPMFNKFRVPAMMQITLFFLMAIFAGYGVAGLFSIKDENKKATVKKIYIITAVFVAISLVPLLFGSSFSFEKAGEAKQYSGQVVKLFQQARLEMMQADGLRLLLFALITGLVLSMSVKGKLKREFAMVILIGLLCFDTIPYIKKAEGEMLNPKVLEKVQFTKSATDKFLEQDDSYFRLFPITDNPFNNNNWSYRHNSIGGYSPAKLRIYQDIVENCIFKGSNPQLPVNWNVMKMLNTKYLISGQQLPPENMNLVYQDKSKELLTYQTTFGAKPAWFVGNTIKEESRKKRFALLNKPTLDVYRTAILEKELPIQISQPDSTSVSMMKVGFNDLSYKVYTDKPALLVISEIYYPEGWRAFVDGKETEIFKTDHVLRSVLIEEAGEHEVKMVFSPERFNKYLAMSKVGHLIAYLFLIGCIVIIFKNKGKE